MNVFRWDSDPGGGWWIFKIHLPEFDECFQYHDSGYDDIKNRTSRITMKELDRRFLANMLRKAASIGWLNKDPGYAVNLSRKAWLCYKLARIWAKTVRAEFERYDPKKDRIWM